MHENCWMVVNLSLGLQPNPTSSLDACDKAHSCIASAFQYMQVNSGNIAAIAWQHCRGDSSRINVTCATSRQHRLGDFWLNSDAHCDIAATSPWQYWGDIAVATLRRHRSDIAIATSRGHRHCEFGAMSHCYVKVRVKDKRHLGKG